MLRSFLEWFDSQLTEKGVAVTIKGFFGLMALALALSAIPGVPAVKTGALVLVILIALTLALTLLNDRRRLKQELDSYRGLLSRYCLFLADRPKPYFRLKNWDQRAIVHPNGDTDERIDVHVETLLKVHFLRFQFNPGWVQPDRYWKRAQAEVHLLLPDGRRVPDSEVTYTWGQGGTLDIIYHLHDPVRSGCELRFQVHWHWPGKSLPLIQNKTDRFFFNFTKAFPVDQARYAIALPPGCDAYHSPIGFNEPHEDFCIAIQEVNDRIEFTFEGRNVPLRHHLGMRLQLK